MDTKGKKEKSGFEGERIAKVMARAGLCSRRDAEAFIAEGRVIVNGKKIDSPALNVGPDDVITVDGKPLPRAEGTRLFVYHKPPGLVTTAKDEKGRPTVFDNLPGGLPRVVSVGRLDLNTEGLMLLTNDGGLARHLELPATGWKRRYRVRVHGTVKESVFAKLRDGISIKGVKYGAIEVTLEKGPQSASNTWLEVSMREGKNREIRNVMEHLDLQVNRLIRVSYGVFTLGDLPLGAAKEVPQKIMRDQIADYFKTK